MHKRITSFTSNCISSLNCIVRPYNNSIRILLSQSITQHYRYTTTMSNNNVNATTQPHAHINGNSTTTQQSQTIVNKTSQLTDTQILDNINSGKLRAFNLENDLERDYDRAVHIRRQYIESKSNADLNRLPYNNSSSSSSIDYSQIFGQCCENVIGYVSIPVGVAGPLLVDGVERYVPLATTEGALVASTSRGCKAISMAGGVNTELIRDGMSRAPVIQCSNIRQANNLKQYIDNNFNELADVFNSTSRFARLQSIYVSIAGRYVYVRLVSSSGEAMGMNMVGKGSEAVMKYLVDKFDDIRVLSLSGNVCTDKKPSAINWTQGRGKSIVAECRISYDIINNVLKSNPVRMVELNNAKNLVGSAMAGSIGGYNAHAANIVSAIFIATGQDPAQVVESANCMTLMELIDTDIHDKPDLYITITMPSIEVGSIGGGTTLNAQRSMIELLGIHKQHGNTSNPDSELSSSQLARIIASTVVAGELSLMAAHAEGHLISSHLKLNRKQQELSNTVNTAQL